MLESGGVARTLAAATDKLMNGKCESLGVFFTVNKCTSWCVKVVEELLSRSGALGKETAKSIADAAMLEVASISMGHMVRVFTVHW